MTTPLKHKMVEITNNHGHSAPLYLLSASIGWNAKWEPAARAEQSKKAAYLIAQAAEILERIEAEEEAEAEASREEERRRKETVR